MKEFTQAERPRLLDLLKRRGPTNVPTLAKELGVNPTAVRQQIAVLEREGLLAMTVERRKVGRPTHLYSLTEKAESLFPQAYGPVALSILRQIRDLDGEEKIDKIFARRTKELAAKYRKRLTGKSKAEKLKTLAQIREEEGYMAEVKGGKLAEHHCPIAEIAREFPLACQYEHKLFESVLGTKLERTRHIASGNRACIYQAISRAT